MKGLNLFLDYFQLFHIKKLNTFHPLYTAKIEPYPLKLPSEHLLYCEVQSKQ